MIKNLKTDILETEITHFLILIDLVSYMLFNIKDFNVVQMKLFNSNVNYEIDE